MRNLEGDENLVKNRRTSAKAMGPMPVWDKESFPGNLKKKIRLRKWKRKKEKVCWMNGMEEDSRPTKHIIYFIYLFCFKKSYLCDYSHFHHNPSAFHYYIDWTLHNAKTNMEWNQNKCQKPRILFLESLE